jgi:hypothetical protein
VRGPCPLPSSPPMCLPARVMARPLDIGVSVVSPGLCPVAPPFLCGPFCRLTAPFSCRLCPCRGVVRRWSGWNLGAVRTVYTSRGRTSGTDRAATVVDATLTAPGSVDTVLWNPEALARLHAGGDLEFDVYAKSAEDDAVSFTLATPTPRVLTEAANARHRLMRSLLHPGACLRRAERLSRRHSRCFAVPCVRQQAFPFMWYPYVQVVRR